MTFTKPILLTLICSGVFAAYSQGIEWRRTRAAFASPVRALCINSQGDILAGTEGGMYRSTNGGEDWSEIRLNLTWPSVVSIVAVAGDVLLAGVNTDVGTVIRSTDAGETWNTDSLLKPTDRIRSLTIVRGGDILVGTDAAILRSSHAGEGWEHLKTGLDSAYFFSSLLVAAGGCVFAGTCDFIDGGGYGVYRSTDNGTSWSRASHGLTSLEVQSLAVDSSGIVFAGVRRALLQSGDNGKNWSTLETGTTDTHMYPVLCSRNGQVFVGTSIGVLVSDNRRMTWVLQKPGGTAVESIAAEEHGGVFLGTYGGEVYRGHLR